MSKARQQHEDPADLGELLTAWLDDELEPARREQVDALLARDAQARGLLAELRETAQAVNRLPREPAPADLADSIRGELERAALLNEDQSPPSVGRSHLLLRRSLAAAAMLMLTGAVGFIIYRVLATPAPTLPADGPETAMRVERLEPSAHDTAAFLAQSEARFAEARRSAGEVRYGAVHLVVRGQTPESVLARVEDLVTRGDLGQVVRTELDRDGRQYALLVPIGQVPTLLSALEDAGRVNLRLGGGDEAIEVRDVPESLVLTLAGEPARGRRLRNALASDTIADDAGAVAAAEMPEWLARGLAQGQVEFRDIELLGPGELTPLDPNAPETAPLRPRPTAPIQPPVTDEPAETVELVAVIITVPGNPPAEPEEARIPDPPAAVDAQNPAIEQSDTIESPLSPPSSPLEPWDRQSIPDQQDPF